MAAYIGAADAIREHFGCLVIIVHHCGIDGTRPRGHTSLTGAVEAQLAVKRDSASQIITTVEHMKDGPEGEVFVSTLAVVEVGTDDDGDKITSCVVKPSNKPPARTGKGAGLTDAVFNTFTLLKRAIEDEGQKPPASNHIPAGAKVVTMSLWREYHKTGAGHERDKSKKGAGQRRDKDGTNETVRKEFQRAYQKLKKINMIGLWDGWVWITDGDERDRSGTPQGPFGTGWDTTLLRVCPCPKPSQFQRLTTWLAKLRLKTGQGGFPAAQLPNLAQPNLSRCKVVGLMVGLVGYC